MITLTPGKLTLPHWRRIRARLGPAHARFREPRRHRSERAGRRRDRHQGRSGVRHQYGLRAARQYAMPAYQLELLQRNLVLSHALGVGEPMSRPVVQR